MKEIIIVTAALGDGGAERVQAELADEWTRLGNQVTIVQAFPDVYVYEHTYRVDDAIRRVDIDKSSRFRIANFLIKARILTKFLKKNGDATVVAFDVPSQFTVALCSKFIKNKIVMSERNNPATFPPSKLVRRMRDWAIRHADECVFQTRQVMEMFPESVQRRGHIILNPINPNLPDRFIGKRRRAIACVGRLHPQKNMPMLINAFYKFSEKHGDYDLEIYGQGDEEANIIKFINELGLADKVKLKGFQTDVMEKIKDAAMYVSSSDYEGISNAMLEALGMGMPVIVTDCPIGGAAITINDGENGVLIPVGDSEALCSAMCCVAEDEAFADKISENAYKIREKLPIEKIAKQWLEVM